MRDPNQENPAGKKKKEKVIVVWLKCMSNCSNKLIVEARTKDVRYLGSTTIMEMLEQFLRST